MCYLSINLSINIYNYLYIYLSIYLSIYLPINQSIYRLGAGEGVQGGSLPGRVRSGDAFPQDRSSRGQNTGLIIYSYIPSVRPSICLSVCPFNRVANNLIEEGLFGRHHINIRQSGNRRCSDNKREVLPRGKGAEHPALVQESRKGRFMLYTGVLNHLPYLLSISVS